MSEYIVGTGWWCDGSGCHAGVMREKSFSSTRMLDFFDTWYQHVTAYTNPSTIIVVDSDSPVKPEFSKYEKVQCLSLTRNFPPFEELPEGKNPFSLARNAASRQMYIGAFYAYLTGADYYVWIEQDCLIHGKGIIDRAIKRMDKAGAELSMGHYEVLDIEMSVSILKAASVPRIFNRYLELEQPQPERRYWQMIQDEFVKFEWLPFNGGRNKPIDFTQEFYYGQHLSEKQVERFKEELDK